MIWQDVVISVGQVLFIFALVPSLVTAMKPPRSTCAITGGILAVFSFTWATLGLWYGSITAGLCAACWIILFFQARHKGMTVLTVTSTVNFIAGDYLQIGYDQFKVVQVLNKTSMIVAKE